MKKTLIIFSLSALMLSCNDQDKTETKTTSQDSATEKKTSTDDDASPATNAQLLNNITVETKGGVKVDRAFLAYESGDLVPADNKIAYDRKVKLNLNLDGWAEEGGKVFVGASEKIVSAEGDVVLDPQDLFLNFADGLPAQDAKFIKLSVNISSGSKPTAYYLVSFRVWNKKGEGEVTGSYKLHVE